MEKKRRVTITDLANELDLSIGTISRGLRGDVAIKKATRDKILVTAVSLGYRTDRNIAGKSSTRSINGDRPDADNRKTTIYDIASLVNLSVATVSRALNDSDKVRETTKQKVQSAAKALEFQFNTDAKLLVNGKNEVSGQPKAVTIYDIAQKLRLSPSTVSRCLSNKEGVKKKTKRIVLKVANDLGYISNFQARQLKRRGVITIGVLVPGFNKSINSILAGIEKVAADEGTGLVISNALYFKNGSTFSVGQILELVDGIIIIPDYNNDVHSLSKILHGLTKPNIWLGTFKNHFSFETITIDPFQATYDLTTHLIRRGCRDLCFIDPTDDITYAADSLRGFTKAIHDNELIPENNFIFQGHTPNKPLDEIAGSIVSKAYLPDGIILINSQFNSKSTLALKNAGIDTVNAVVVCELDYGITGNENLEQTNKMTYDLNDLGQKGIRRLITKLTNPFQLSGTASFAKHRFIVNQHVSVYDNTISPAM